MPNGDNRYDGYYVIKDMDLEEVGFDEVPKKYVTKRCLILSLTITICVLLLLFIVVFVGFPVAFMNSITLQQIMVFTHFGLPDNKSFFSEFKFPSYQNKYIKIVDLENKDRNITLGMWHILPETLAYQALHDESFDYEQALRDSNYSVLLYFHGTGESRADSHRKYQLLSRFFHIIAFDYRSYADSSSAFLSQRAVVNDCLQLYDWLKNKTNSSIYFWGHSFGAALAALTAADLEELSEAPKVLVLESGFTSLKDELYVHPYAKIFAWLPWFEATVVNPLIENGFIFDTANAIRKIKSQIMILHAEDDGIIPVKFGRKLLKIASERNQSQVVYHEFKKTEELGHLFIYQDPFLKYYIMDFLNLTNKNWCV